MSEAILTSDGARLRFKRRRGDGPPVVLFHGLAVNADVFDIPPMTTGSGREFRSITDVLHERGFDVWLVNLRGCGGPHVPSEPPAGLADWCVDHFILYDVKAAIEHVAEVRSQPVFALGQSMGGMALAGYLQGASAVGYGEFHSVVADETAARKRQRGVRGAIFLESPAVLRWPQSLYDESGRLKWQDLFGNWKRTDSDLNFPFEMLARSAWLHALVDASGTVRLDWIRPNGGWRERFPANLLDKFGLTDRAISAAARTFAERVKGSGEFHPELFVNGLMQALDKMKSGVLKQLSKCVRAGQFVSATGEPDHVYSDHYDLIELPVLSIVGGRDRIANATMCREAFFDRVSSRDKQFLQFDELAHGEFEYSPQATAEVYPAIAEWMAVR